MNARQRKLLLKRTVMRRRKTSEVQPQRAVVAVDIETNNGVEWQLVEPLKFQGASWEPGSLEQAESRLDRKPIEFDWEGLTKELRDHGALHHVRLPVQLPLTPEQHEEINEPFPLHDYQRAAMECIRAAAHMHPVVFEMPSRHSATLLSALRRAEQEPMILIAPRQGMGTMTFYRLKERMNQEGPFTVNLNFETLLTDEQENKDGD
jgi:hypothetical protein